MNKARFILHANPNAKRISVTSTMNMRSFSIVDAIKFASLSLSHEVWTGLKGFIMTIEDHWSVCVLCWCIHLPHVIRLLAGKVYPSFKTKVDNSEWSDGRRVMYRPTTGPYPHHPRSQDDRLVYTCGNATSLCKSHVTQGNLQATSSISKKKHIHLNFLC